MVLRFLFGLEYRKLQQLTRLHRSLFVSWTFSENLGAASLFKFLASDDPWSDKLPLRCEAALLPPEIAPVHASLLHLLDSLFA